MKKIFSIIAVIALVFSMTACMNKEKNNDIVQNPNNNVVVDNNGAGEHNNGSEENNGSVEDPTKDENYNRYIAVQRLNKYDVQQSIELPESEEGNYTWKCIIEDETVLKNVESRFDSTMLEDGTESPVGTRVTLFEGLKEGKTNVTFKNNHVNEDGSPSEEVTFVLAVNSENKVAIVDEIRK